MNKKLEYQKLKICFVSLNSYPQLKEENLGYAGGAEVQQVELAKELKKRGYHIFFITYGENHSDNEKVDGIEIVPTYNRNEVNNLSFLSKMLCIWRKMKEVDADIYFYRAGSPGITSIFGILHQKKVIKSVASDAEVTGDVIIKKDMVVMLLGKIGSWLDIKLSDLIISQNNFQKTKLKKRFKVESVIIKNAFGIPSQISTDCNADYLLWVGTFRSVKQPFVFLKIAKYLPKYKFLMLGGEGESPELFRKIKNAAKEIPNLDFMGFVAHNKIFDYYKKAILLVNTSKIEGFPNVFLEAWIHSIPVISLNIDPDGIISKFKLGYHSETFNRMINDIRNLLENKGSRVEMGKNGRKYVETYHNVESIVDRYENLFKYIYR